LTPEARVATVTVWAPERRTAAREMRTTARSAPRMRGAASRTPASPRRSPSASASGGIPMPDCAPAPNTTAPSSSSSRSPEMDRQASAPTLMLLNGAPGSGKSTLAVLLAAERPLALALDIDTIKHSLGRWGQGLQAAGLRARRLAVVMIRRHLADGHDVVIGQYLARTPFLGELEQLAADCGARFLEAALVLDER